MLVAMLWRRRRRRRRQRMRPQNFRRWRRPPKRLLLWVRAPLDILAATSTTARHQHLLALRLYTRWRRRMRMWHPTRPNHRPAMIGRRSRHHQHRVRVRLSMLAGPRFHHISPKRLWPRSALDFRKEAARIAEETALAVPAPEGGRAC